MLDGMNWMNRIARITVTRWSSGISDCERMSQEALSGLEGAGRLWNLNGRHGGACVLLFLALTFSGLWLCCLRGGDGSLRVGV